MNLQPPNAANYAPTGLPRLIVVLRHKTRLMGRVHLLVSGLVLYVHRREPLITWPTGYLRLVSGPLDPNLTLDF